LRITDTGLRRELWQGTRSASQLGQQRRAFQPSQRKPTIAEQTLLEFLLTSEDVRASVLPQLDPADYGGLATEEIFKAVLHCEREGIAVEYDTLLRFMEPESPITAILPRLFANEPIFDEDGNPVHGHTPESCLAELKLAAVDRQIDEVSAEKNEAERNGNDERRDELAMRQIELTRLRNALMPQARAVHAENL